MLSSFGRGGTGAVSGLMSHDICSRGEHNGWSASSQISASHAYTFTFFSTNQTDPIDNL
ncbi:hypothetical protein MAR_038561 [Mya arenaria]|uniref:Uncharacterized protein n=1 Tax=Mya arenaria TaxID=6604 RepID=A0ABY7FRW3_MYAAR|nr:hypothetical protein MAR_038561 [Mya arenaria]